MWCWVPCCQGPPYCSLLSVSHQPARPHYSTIDLFPPHPQAIKKWSYAFMAVKLQLRTVKSQICKETCVWDFQQWLSNSQLQAPRAEPTIFAETLYVLCNSFIEKAPKPRVRRKPNAHTLGENWSEFMEEAKILPKIWQLFDWHVPNPLLNAEYFPNKPLGLPASITPHLESYFFFFIYIQGNLPRGFLQHKIPRNLVTFTFTKPVTEHNHTLHPAQWCTSCNRRSQGSPWSWSLCPEC